MTFLLIVQESLLGSSKILECLANIKIHEKYTYTSHYILFGPAMVAGRVLWNRIYPTFCPSFCPSLGRSICPSVFPDFRLSGRFLGIVSLVFSKFWDMLETHMKLCMTEPYFLEKIFLPSKLEKWTKNGSKNGFLNFLKNLVINFYWICSIMKIYITWCVPAQIPYLRNCYSWDSGQNVLSQSDCRIFQSTISVEQISKITWIFAGWYKFT